MDTNPFANVAAQSSIPAERRAYISDTDTEKLTAVCNPTWRIIIALARYAGLRCPSEVLSLKWSDVNFETGRMTVPSCKTEHIPGKAYRVVPIFANLKSYLDEAFELAEGGAEYVVPGEHRKAALKPTGWMNCNLRTQLLKLIKRAGLQPWPRLFHNLRASCETDLMATHPIHVTTAWLGNTPTIALKHYLQVLDTDFEKAAKSGAESGAVEVQNVVQSRSAGRSLEMTRTPQPLVFVGVGCPLSSAGTSCSNTRVGATGFGNRSRG
jgi:integrase